MEIPIKMDDLGGFPPIFGNIQLFQLLTCRVCGSKGISCIRKNTCVKQSSSKGWNGFIGEFSCWNSSSRSMVMVKPTRWVSISAIGLPALLPTSWQLSSLRSGDTHHTSDFLAQLFLGNNLGQLLLFGPTCWQGFQMEFHFDFVFSTWVKHCNIAARDERMKSTKFGLLTTANPLLQVNDQAIARQQWFCEEILLGGLMACNHISSKWSYKWKPNILWGASEIGIHQLNERFEVSSSCPQKMGKNKFAMFSRELNYKYGNQKSTTWSIKTGGFSIAMLVDSSLIRYFGQFKINTSHSQTAHRTSMDFPRLS